MSVRVLRFGSREQQARDLAEANLHKLEGHVLGTVRRQLSSDRIHLPRPDLEAAYNQAWHGVCQIVARGERVKNLEGLLVTITRRRAIDVYRQRKEGLFTDGPLKEHYADNSDLVEQVDDRRKVARLVGRMVGRLNEKERNAVALCVLHGYTRPEAAKLLGESEPAFQKIMDRASRKIAGFVVGIDARGCGDDEWARLLAERWPDQKRRLALCPGKEVCAKLNQRLQGKRKQAVSSTKLARDLRASEIEPEARDLLLRLDRLGQ